MCSIEIDLDLNPWVSELSTSEQKKAINQILYSYWESRNYIETDSITHVPRISPLLHSSIQLVESKLDTLQAKTDHQHQIIHKLTTFTDKMIGSSEKGKIGELLVEKILQEHFPDAVVSCTAKSSRESDIHLQLSDSMIPKILVESNFINQWLLKKKWINFIEI